MIKLKLLYCFSSVDVIDDDVYDDEIIDNDNNDEDVRYQTNEKDHCIGEKKYKGK